MSVKSKQTIQLEQQFLYNLSQIVEMFPQYTLSQHIVHFLRTKGDKDPYYWSNDLLLKKVEEYYDELKNDLTRITES